MNSVLMNIFGRQASDIRGKVIGIYALLIGANLGAWAWALAAFHDNPVLLGTALLAYTFGLRHAVDADHIAAIDNVTRKLMQDGKRPTAVGLFFALGHSSIILLGVIVIALTEAQLQGRFQSIHSDVDIVSTMISAGFLLVIAIMNMVIAAAVYRTFRNVRDGGTYVAEDFDLLLNSRGMLSRVFRRLFRLVAESWHMLPLGLLFGLGFDTATEASLLGVAGSQAAHGMSVWSILAFPALFAAGMSLIDTTDGILMLGAYGWAFVKPIRKLYYNLTITVVSATVALGVGGIEALGLIGDQFNLDGPFWDMISHLNGNFGIIGYTIIGIFIASWIVSFVIYRLRGYDEIEVNTATS